MPAFLRGSHDTSATATIMIDILTGAFLFSATACFASKCTPLCLATELCVSLHAVLHLLSLLFIVVLLLLYYYYYYDDDDYYYY